MLESFHRSSEKQNTHQVELKVNTEGDTVDNVRLHPVENLTRDLNRRNDRTETFVQKDNIRRSPCSVRRAFHRNTTVGFLQRGRIIFTSDQRTTLSDS